MAVTNVIMMLTKKIAVGMINRILRLRVSKIDQWGELSVARTENEIMLAQNSDILGLTISEATNVTGEVVVCGINLFY